MGAIIETQPRLLASLWRYKWYIVATAILAAAVGYGLSSLQNTLYSADGTVLLNDPRSSGGLADEIGLVLDPRRYVNNQAKIIESSQVAQRAAEEFGGGITASDVQAATEATPASDLDAIAVSASMPTGAEATAMVDVLVGAYEAIITEQVQSAVNGSIATLEAAKAETEIRLAELDALIAQDPDDSVVAAQRIAAIDQLVIFDTRIEFLATNAALYGSGVQIYVAPTTPTTPTQPLPIRNAALALVLGTLVAGGLAWWRGEHKQVADDRDLPAVVLDAPLLAAIPVFKAAEADGPIPTVTHSGSGATEAYQFALSSIGFALETIGGTTVLITSTSPGDGKSATAVNLSISAAQDGRRVLLIDADERSRGLTRLSGLLDEVGISDFNGPASVERATHRWDMEDGTSLEFVPAGTGISGNTATFFRSSGFSTALGALLKGREMVIFDSPPVMAAAETTDIGAAVDAIVLVVREGTPLRNLEDARQRLTMSGTPIIGYIFNGATPRSGMYGYGYGYGYDVET